MNKHKAHLICGTCMVMAMMVFHAPSSLADRPIAKLTNDLKMQVISENDMDLGVDEEGETDSQMLELKSKLEGNLTDNISYLLEARGVKNYGEGGSFDIETGEATGREDFLELRQYWADFDNVLGVDPVSLRIGRQRIREDYGLWWNRDLDAVRIFYETTLLNGFIGVGQNLAEYRTSDDSYNEDDEEIFRLIGETLWQWKLDQYVEGRFLYQDDHSGIENAGETVEGDDFDSADGDLLWAGLRLTGAFDALLRSEKGTKSIYRLDVMGVVGEEDDLLTTTGPGDLRTVTGSEDQDVFGWAVDAGLDIPVPISGPTSLEPVMTVGYAYGSGDDNVGDGDDNAFRQTGLDGNSSKLGDFSSSVNNYGSVLRPDLSNIHIATLGLTLPITEYTDVAGFYRYYRLAEEDGAIVSAVSGTLNGEDSDLGHGFDVIMNMNVADQWNLHPKPLDRINFKTTMGAFRAGDAYGEEEGETALRGQVDLSVRF